jgi:hypothetical protein
MVTFPKYSKIKISGNKLNHEDERTPVCPISPLPFNPFPLPPYPPHFQAEPVLPLSLILSKRIHKHNKEDKEFLLTEIRMPIQRDSSIAPTYKCVTTQVDSSLPDLFTSSQSPSHIDLCCVKVSVLVPLQWAHQTLSCFWFPKNPHISRMCSPLVMWSKSKNTAVFALDLKSAYEVEHTIFGLLGLPNLAQNNFSSSMHLPANDKISFFFMV